MRPSPRLFGLILLPLLYACVMSQPMPGAAPSATPPQLIPDGDTLIWNDPSLFGPVPPQLQFIGDLSCARDGFERAIGYHPGALDPAGRPVTDGGFYCLPKQ